jgi:hypothetical protein
MKKGGTYQQPRVAWLRNDQSDSGQEKLDIVLVLGAEDHIEIYERIGIVRVLQSRNRFKDALIIAFEISSHYIRLRLY